jgi:predicted NUDIX family phosphoesterase
MSNPKWDEQIIVVSRKEIFDNENDVFQGVLTDNDKLTEMSFRFDSFSVMRRGNEEDPTPAENNAEINFDYKQPIPYVVVRRGEELFAYKRLSGGGESRLFDKVSIGVGGHMNKEEELDTFSENVFENILRELEEELEIDAQSIVITTLGLINDDSDEVGKVHIGILVVADLEPNNSVEVKEKDQLVGEWMTMEKLNEPEIYSKLENWTKLALTVLK